MKNATQLLILIALLGAAIYGWFANIVKFIGLIGDPLTAEVVIRAIGIFLAPLGVILGFL